MPTDTQHTHTFIQPSTSQPQMKQRSKRPKRKDTQVSQYSVYSDNVADEAFNEEMDNSLVRAATTASSLEAERQDTMRDTIAQPWFENVSKTSNDSLLTGNTKTAQAQEITSLKLRVKKLEKKGGSRTHKLKRLYKVGRSTRVIASDEASLCDQEDASKQGRKIDDIDKDAEITLDMAEKGINVAEKEVSTTDLVTTAGEVVTTICVEISTASPTETIIADDLTLAQTLIEIGSKAIIEEPEKPTKRKDQIRHDKEVAQRLQAQMQAESGKKIGL
ncbi:hypothetical protein Tco_0993239 [Tanacetum coccineum]|uniref:Uncharacterized protein n=1 Tax=Tanacetum coccineum TaxID=301880 RepID=A0ABQ5F5N1_9ASTR